MNTKAETRQVNGTHYKDYAIQPVRFALVNGWDFCAGSALKHVIRHKQKEGIVDLDKARHHGELRAEILPTADWTFFLKQRSLYNEFNRNNNRAIPMSVFIDTNRIQEPELVKVLDSLDLWVRAVDTDGTGYFTALQQLKDKHYPVD